MKTQQEIIIDKFDLISLKYHKLSLLFNELAGSLRMKYRELGEGRVKDFKNYLKELSLDIDKLKEQSSILSSIEMKGGKDI